MAEHTKQHIIPASYLKEWCDPNVPENHTPYIWIFDSKDHTSKKKAPAKSFYENNFYTIIRSENDRDLTIEKEFSKVESAFANIRKNKLLTKSILTYEELFQVFMFMATIHARTPKRINFMTSQLEPLMDKMEEMVKFEKNASEEEKKAIINIATTTHNESSISYEDLKVVVNNPIENIMISAINAEAKALLELDFAVLYTEKDDTFITSDNPCVWYDSKAHLRPPLHQSPALKYESIEIILPISPTHCILLNRKNLNGYINVDTNPERINYINQLVFENSEKKYISNDNTNIIERNRGILI